MTTLAGARGALRAAVEAADIIAAYAPGGTDPPYVVIAGDGIDLSRRVRAEATFRLICIGGLADAEASALELDTLKLAIVGIIRGLNDWRMVDVSADRIRLFAGTDYLTADVRTSTLIDPV